MSLISMFMPLLTVIPFAIPWFLFALLISSLRNRLKRNCKYVTVGEIVDIDCVDKGNSKLYYNIYSFEVNGEYVEARSNVGSSVAGKIGDQVSLCYNKSNPSEIYVSNEYHILSIISMIMIGISLFILSWGIISSVVMLFGI